MNLIKPKKLKRGDKVATISLSWGGAGDQDILWRYQVGKQRLFELFGLEVVEMPNTLKGSKYIYNHPEKRAEDLMMAFEDKAVKGIFSCIGGDESVRILPFIDLETIRKNPKVFIGYSDSTVTHMACLKAGLTSFHGPSILAEFAENVEMDEYTKKWIDKVLFSNEIIGEIEPSTRWTSEYLPWEEVNRNTRRTYQKNGGYELLQGHGFAEGHLIGGCIEVLEMLKGTEYWPSDKTWENAILFLETSEDKPSPLYLEYWLRNYGSQGILQKISGVIFAKPYDNVYYEEYNAVLKKVIRDELGLTDLPILCNLNFGHTAPIMVIPYGVHARIDCGKGSFAILDSGVI